jgi:hypothetical protein
LLSASSYTETMQFADLLGPGRLTEDSHKMEGGSASCSPASQP